ncbi:aspartate aminotransferase family protein [Pelagerythrobacter rhizovicinus]|uniref:Aspartate aminotransferase family protein n=1 Tax=Pelagerythrobacter rhizovicinus TaxID=2268576 RepID=A0A4Q2KPE4_9SPHN|nr:aspartate aminotransferase family protein [Pelagerythrobacter rhizovicinus]RXZ66387.1 aspartate aminotransferase family protein [Pelagerythrobacter rhizovicinus]
MDQITTTTAEWQALDREHHLHPFTDPKVLGEQGVRVFTQADGCYIWDSDGNKILDTMAGLWCVNVGYGRQELVDAASKQMATLPYYNTFFSSSTPTQIRLARRLSELTPAGLDYFFFANSGSEANDTIIRLVRHFWEVQGQPSKNVFIGRTLGYHGSTLAATSLGGMAPMHAMGQSLLPGFEHIIEPHWYRHGQGKTPEEFGLEAARALETKILELGAENVAAFVGEPLQGAGGVIDPPSTYWPEIQRICKKYDVLLVADEVICGFGRTGNWFGSDTYGIEPDLMPMAKGLSSGYLPIAAVAMNKRVSDAINGGGVISHGYTYSGHPVSCAVALANIDIIEREGLIDKVREETAPYFRDSLQQLADSHPIVGELRGVSLIAGLQLVRDKASREFFAPTEQPAIECREHCIGENLILRAVGHTMVACPPLTIGRSEIDEMIEKTKIGLDKTAAAHGLL